MSCNPTTDATSIGNAEQGFRDAFERLKNGKPKVLKAGTPVTQNNVAKEAGRDPTALKKARYPRLVLDIQNWIERQPTASATPSPRQTMLGTRRRNRSLKEKIESLKTERDLAMSLLVEADAKILELTMENARLTALSASDNVTPFRSEPAAVRPVQ